MAKYTYNRQYAARYGDACVIVPDQVAEDQRGWDQSGKSFPAICTTSCGNQMAPARKVRVRLDGDAYCLWGGGGNGDMVVKSA